MATNNSVQDTLAVRELMTRSNLVTVTEQDALDLALELMTASSVRHLPVLADRKVVGVLTEGNARRRAAQATRRDLRVQDAMARPAQIVRADDPAGMAARSMARDELGCLPVVDGDGDDLVGIITRSDLLHLVEDSGGTLAAPGTRPVHKVMATEIATIPGDAALVAAAERMQRLEVEHLPVVDRDYRIVGMLAAADIRDAFARCREMLEDERRRPRIRELRVWTAMSTPVITVRRETPVEDALCHIVGRRIGALPVVDEDETLLGLVLDVDLLEPVIGSRRTTAQ
jgi:CBS domain-containing protein